jgi:hypothetical protein
MLYVVCYVLYETNTLYTINCILNSHRLRWNSHTTSRLRLFYGRFEEAIPSYLEYLLSPIRGARGLPARSPPIQHTILVLGKDNGSQLVSRFMQQLHYLVPESATAFHLDRHCRPLLGETMIHVYVSCVYVSCVYVSCVCVCVCVCICGGNIFPCESMQCAEYDVLYILHQPYILKICMPPPTR